MSSSRLQTRDSVVYGLVMRERRDGLSSLSTLKRSCTCPHEPHASIQLPGTRHHASACNYFQRNFGKVPSYFVTLLNDVNLLTVCFEDFWKSSLEEGSGWAFPHLLQPSLPLWVIDFQDFWPLSSLIFSTVQGALSLDIRCFLSLLDSDFIVSYS